MRSIAAASGVRALVIALGAAVALVIPAGAAFAAPGTDCPTGGGGGGGYPGSSCTLSVSDSTVVAGEEVTVSGSGFQPGTPYTIKLGAAVLATGTADSSTITDTVTIPASTSPGDYTLSLIGTDADGGPRELDAAITVVERMQAAPSQEGGGLAATGASSSTLPLAGAGAGLLLVGAGALVYSRRRRTTR